MNTKTIKLGLFIALAFISTAFSQEVNKQEGIHTVPDYIVNRIQNFKPLAETYPGFLTRRGDYDKLKRLSGNGKGIKVGIVDTGLDDIHSKTGGDLELGLAVKAAKDFTRSRKGYLDSNGHGTHVAGHIGARKNGSGIEGIASDCDLYIAKGLGDQGFGTDSQLSTAIVWLIDQDVDIISLSLGGGFSPSIEKACQLAARKGILVFAALGNDGNRGDGHPGNSDYTFGIAAVDYDLSIAGFSSRSNKAVFSGYGVNVFSTINGGRYAEFSGTSMATPDQAGLAALILGYTRQRNIPINNMDDYLDFVKPAIMDLGAAGKDREYGYGFIVASKVITDEAPVIEPDPEDPFPDPDQPEQPYKGFKKVGELILQNKRYILLEEIK